MARCFVIQPFDGDKFDKRYEDTFKPAIEAAGLESYRVDQDPSVTIPIEEIERGIRESDICFAEISTDNPNVWYELGFAIAAQKDVVMVCSDVRPNKFPFDVQHRNIIKYKTDSASDFEALSTKIKDRIVALLNKRGDLTRLTKEAPVVATNGLSQIEIVALIILMQNCILSGEYVAAYSVKQDMNNAGFTDIAVSIALKGLVKKDMAIWQEGQDGYGNLNNEYKVTDEGEKWIMDHQDLLELRVDPNELIQGAPNNDESDHLPF